MKTIPYSQFKHGQRVTCKIEREQIDDAKISIDEYGEVYVCQNKKDGCDTDDKLGYAYSWSIYGDDREPTSDSGLTDLIFLDRSIEDVQEGDVVWSENDEEITESKVLGRCGEVVFLSKTNIHSVYGQAVTIAQLKAANITIKQDTPPTLTEVTLQEVAEKIGVPVEQLRIKE